MRHQPVAAIQAPPPPILGCDVAKATIRVHDDVSGRSRNIDKKPDALAALIAGHPGHHVFIEATGGYELALVEAALAQAYHHRLRRIVGEANQIGYSNARAFRGVQFERVPHDGS